jgi:hypothetical protein
MNKIKMVGLISDQVIREKAIEFFVKLDFAIEFINVADGYLNEKAFVTAKVIVIDQGFDILKIAEVTEKFPKAKIVSYGRVTSLSDYVSLGGKVVIDPLWINYQWSFPYWKKILSGESSMHLKDYLGEEVKKIKSQKLFNLFKIGSQLDEILISVSHMNVSFVTIRSFIDHLFLFAQTVKEKKLASLPIDLEFKNSEKGVFLLANFTTIPMTEGDFLDLLESKGMVNAEDELLHSCYKLADAMSIFHHQARKLTTITALWIEKTKEQVVEFPSFSIQVHGEKLLQKDKLNGSANNQMSWNRTDEKAENKRKQDQFDEKEIKNSRKAELARSDLDLSNEIEAFFNNKDLLKQISEFVEMNLEMDSPGSSKGDLTSLQLKQMIKNFPFADEIPKLLNEIDVARLLQIIIKDAWKELPEKDVVSKVANQSLSKSNEKKVLKDEILNLGPKKEKAKEEVLDLGPNKEKAKEEVLDLGPKKEKAQEEILDLGPKKEKAQEEILDLGPKKEKAKEEVLDLGPKKEKAQEEVLDLGPKKEKAQEEILDLGPKKEKAKEEVLDLGIKRVKAEEELLILHASNDSNENAGNDDEGHFASQEEDSQELDKETERLVLDNQNLQNKVADLMLRLEEQGSNSDQIDNDQTIARINNEIGADNWNVKRYELPNDDNKDEMVKFLSAKLENGESLHQDDAKNLMKVFAQEREFQDRARELEKQHKLAMIAFEKKDVLYKNELDEYKKKLHSKEILLSQAQEGIKSSLFQKDKLISNLQRSISDLKKQTEQSSINKLETKMQLLERDKKSMHKTIEMYKEKLQEASKNKVLGQERQAADQVNFKEIALRAEASKKRIEVKMQQLETEKLESRRDSYHKDETIRKLNAKNDELARKALVAEVKMKDALEQAKMSSKSMLSDKVNMKDEGLVKAQAQIQQLKEQARVNEIDLRKEMAKKEETANLLKKNLLVETNKAKILEDKIKELEAKVATHEATKSATGSDGKPAKAESGSTMLKMAEEAKKKLMKDLQDQTAKVAEAKKDADKSKRTAAELQAKLTAAEAELAKLKKKDATAAAPANAAAPVKKAG